MRVALLLILFFAAVQSPFGAVAASPSTGNGLYSLCSAEKRTAEDFMKHRECMGYILGASDMGGTLRLFCFPDGVTVGQVRDLVVNGLQADVANRHRGSAFLIARYLRPVFPCPR